MSRTPTCHYHCSRCHRHFGSLNSFDAHRVGDHDAGTRRCESPLDVLDPAGNTRLEVVRGRCEVYRDRTGYGVEEGPIWRLAGEAAGAAARLRGVAGSPDPSESVSGFGRLGKAA